MRWIAAILTRLAEAVLNVLIPEKELGEWDILEGRWIRRWR